MADRKDPQEELSRQADRRARLTEAQVERLVGLLQRFLERTLRRTEKAFDADAVSVAQVARVLADLDGVVRAAGLGDILQSVRELFQQELQLTLEDFADSTGQTPQLSGFARDNLSALVDDRLRVAARLVSEYVADIRTVVLDSVVLGKTPDLSEATDTIGNRYFSYMTTELNTALIAFQRVAHFETADRAGITKFLYVGPLDKVIRPFCRKHVGRIYTREEIAALDNEQGLPVELYGGGYNCRHHWRPVSDALAKELQQDRADRGEE